MIPAGRYKKRGDKFVAHLILAYDEAGYVKTTCYKEFDREVDAIIATFDCSEPYGWKGF